jgi:hypothetical protein
VTVSRWAVAAALLASTSHASAMAITADYSLLGTVYQDSSSGRLFDSDGAGRTDVTGLLKANVSTAIGYWESAVLLPYSQTISFRLFDLTSEFAVADTRIDSFDPNNRPLTTTIRLDDAQVPFWLDPTPLDNSEFALSTISAGLGGDIVNVGRFGQAIASPANSGFDLLSLLLHEIQHSLGFSSGTARWDAVVDPTGTVLTVPTSVSGLPSSYDIPIAGSHINGMADNGLFNDTSIALPGFNSGERALLSAVDIEAVCTIEGCAGNQLNTDPRPSALSVPEPDTALLVAVAGLGLVFSLRHRRRHATV